MKKSMLLLLCLFSISLFSQDLSVIRDSLIKEGKITTARKELLSLYDKKMSVGDERALSEILSLLGEYTGVPYRTIFNMCRKARLDCTYYKAKFLESQGNAGSAMDLFLEAGYYDDYSRLKAYSGEDLNVLAKRYGLSEERIFYYQGLLYIAKGDWDKAINMFSEKKLSLNPKAKFYLGYAFLMKGENAKAKEIVERMPASLGFFDRIEYRRLKAIISYADNDQFQAQDVLLSILKDVPGDLLSKRYLAHIYYRTGWFDKAEKIYAELIGKEWRDTELYYLLSERCEMRIRNLKFDLAKKDADKIIAEYPGRKDFIADTASLFLKYGGLKEAEYYSSRLSTEGTLYEQGLVFYVKGQIDEFKLSYQEALTMYQKAMDLFPSEEYKNRIAEAKRSMEEIKKDAVPAFSCSGYEVKKLSSNNYLVDIRKNTHEVYYIKVDNEKGTVVVLPLSLVYDPDRINFNEKEKVWSQNIQRTWSSSQMKLEVIYTTTKGNAGVKGESNRVDVVPWPSSFYLKRVSSHEWSVLTPPSIVAHEAGHLLGLDDEYYETDQRIADRNKGRFIGPTSSIMRNMYSGRPEKRHIHFILSPLKCR